MADKVLRFKTETGLLREGSLKTSSFKRFKARLKYSQVQRIDSPQATEALLKTDRSVFNSVQFKAKNRLSWILLAR